MVFMMTDQFSGGQTARSPPSEECPRCGSTNTKFCYYNNYDKSQPRHFCKSCKRHWTKGGTLRDIPAGRRRTNKRPRTSTVEAQQKSNFDQKNMSNILYQALILSSTSSIPQFTILESHGSTIHTECLNAYSAPQNHPNTEFTFSSSTSLISNPASDYCQSSNDYNFAENYDSTEESGTPWPAVNPSTAADIWSWNEEIDLLGRSADLNTVWHNLTFS